MRTRLASIGLTVGMALAAGGQEVVREGEWQKAGLGATLRGAVTFGPASVCVEGHYLCMDVVLTVRNEGRRPALFLPSLERVGYMRELGTEWGADENRLDNDGPRLWLAKGPKRSEYLVVRPGETWTKQVTVRVKSWKKVKPGAQYEATVILRTETPSWLASGKDYDALRKRWRKYGDLEYINLVVVDTIVAPGEPALSTGATESGEAVVP